ncbi:DUF1684 domain-containing protein [uncultured Ferrimonas sp.]|uniref:DUF1684 domain-containing protein n=1 Tax=uncultured Ferrimonas sp. TaxID=432640 RepID=UPI002632905E|nr:DUF1684 domain-containing protein [uncultured Ferrimonas sp.]
MKIGAVALMASVTLLLSGCFGGLTEAQQQDHKAWMEWRSDNDNAARDPNRSFLNIRDATYLQTGESAWLLSTATAEQIRWRERSEGLDFGLTHRGERADIVWHHSSHQLEAGQSIELSERLLVSVGDLYNGGMRAFIRDKRHPLLASFAGYQFFPYNGDAKVLAQFTPTEATPVLFQTVQGLTNRFYRIGLLNFDWQGQQITMPAYHSKPQPPFDSLILFFKDHTNGEQTYGGGRELYLELTQPLSQPIAIDFNYSVNFYCARSTFWNCPILRDPPLSVAITAGETYHKTP